MAILKEIPLDAISIPKDHLRVQSYDPKAIKKLADSILSFGLLVRIIVRPAGEGKYELVDGERRLAAFRSLYDREGRKWVAIPAIVEEMTAQESVIRQVAINENRQDLTPFEKAKGYKLAWETGYFKSYRELASMVGKSHTAVIRLIGIFEKFPREIIEGFESGELKQAHLQYFYALPDRQAMRKLYNAIVKDRLKSSATRTLANRLDERWLSGDREHLIELAESDPELQPLLGSEITIADLVNKSKCTLDYTNLTRFGELVTLLDKLVKSGEFRTTVTQYQQRHKDTDRPRRELSSE